MGGTAIRAPSDDLKNHTTVLTQLKEIAETGLGIRGNPASAYVKISDLVAAGLINYISGVISPGKTTAGGASTVTATNSITGTGTAGSPLKLVGDSASPGASSYYGTNGSSVLGYFALPAGTSPLTTKGDLYGYSTTNIRVPIGSDGQVLTADSTQAAGLKWAPGGGATVGYPGTVADLLYWFQADVPLVSVGSALSTLSNSCPWNTGQIATLSSGAGATRAAALLNSLGVVALPGAGFYLMNAGLSLVKSTVFVVHKPSSVTVTQAYINENGAGALQFYMNTTAQLSIAVSSVALVAASTTTLVVNTWFQGNVTYDSTGGPYAFRVNRAAAGSGTNAHAITAGARGIFADPAAGSPLTGTFAELIVYNRILTGAEIINVENYLFAKWGV